MPNPSELYVGAIMINEENLNGETPEEEPVAQPETTVGEPSITEGENADTVKEEAPADANDTANEDIAPVEKPVERSADVKPVRQKQKSNGMSKTFKAVYFPLVAIVAVVLLVFSVVDGLFGYKPGAYDDKYYTAVETHINTLSKTPRSAMTVEGVDSAVDYIYSALSANKVFIAKDEVKHGDDEEDDADVVTTVTDWATISDSPAPTVTKMTSYLTDAAQFNIGADVLAGYELTDIIAAIPSLKTRQGSASDAVVITVRYDTRPDTQGAGDNAAFVATVMQSLIEIADRGATFDNDIVVVFTEDLDAAYGSHMFFDSFKGLGDVVSRAKVGLDLDAYGNAGTLAITDVSGTALDYLTAFNGAAGTALTSTAVADAIPEEYRVAGAIAAFGNVPAIQVAAIGGMDTQGSELDSAANLSNAIIRQEASLIKSYIEKFSVGTLDFTAEDGLELTSFPYLDWGSVSYNEIASYVIGAIILAAIAAAIALIAVKKTFSIKKLFLALGAELGVIVGSLAAMYLAYFLVTLMLTGFGVLPIHAITRIRYFNAGILIAALLVATAAAFGFTTLFKKLFKVTASDTVRGTALLIALVGAIMSFATPAYSYLTSWLGLLLCVVLIVTTCFNGKFKTKFGFGFDRLFIYVIPAIICLPLVMTPIATLTSILPLVYLPLIMTLFVALIGVIVPYLDRTQPALDRLAKKLPMRTRRVEHIVTETVEDRAKRGKFTERTYKRVDKEKFPVNYKNYFGVSLIAVIGIVIALFSGGFGMTFGRSLALPMSYTDSTYNDALVYECEYDSSGKATQTVVVDDLVAYRYLRHAISDLSWDSEQERYVKSVAYRVEDIIPSAPSIVKNGDVYNVTTFDGPRSTVTITIPSAKSIMSVTLTNSRGDDFKYEFNNSSVITLRMPYGFGDFTFTIEGGSASTVRYEERRAVLSDLDNALANIDEWNDVIRMYTDTYVEGSLRGAIVVKRSFTL